MPPLSVKRGFQSSSSVAEESLDLNLYNNLTKTSTGV